MTKRIFRSIVLTAVLAVLLASALLVSALGRVYEHNNISSLRSEASNIVHALDMMADSIDYLHSLETADRLTFIAPDGTVLYDSAADPASLDSHADRPEVIQALSEGEGESQRYSDTLSITTFYHARRTAQGNVLRIASQRDSIVGMILNVTPQLTLMLLIVVLVSLLIARTAARQIVAPLNQLDLYVPLQNEVYDELSPLLIRMDRQHAQIRSQMQDLEARTSEFQAIMESMREGLLLLSPQGRVLTMNRSAGEIFQAEGDVKGCMLQTLCPNKNVLALVSDAHNGLCGDTVLTAGGRTYHVYASPVQRMGQVHGALLLILDVTERYAAETARREFSANVSHELKTPLTTISGFAEIIRDGIARPEDTPAFAGRIHAEARRLLALVNDIIELSRLDEKQGLGNREPLFLLPLMRQLTDSFAPLAAEKQLTLSLEGDDRQIDGYPLLVREMFHNLIDNAVKYTPAGGRVTVSLHTAEGRPAVTVSDTGVGIAPEHQPHVFERFYRVDKSHSRQTGGTGLGLAIVKHAAQVHHASLTLESEPGRGTAVTVRF